MEDYPNDCGLQSQQKYFGDNLCGSLPRRTNVTHTQKKIYDLRRERINFGVVSR